VTLLRSRALSVAAYVAVGLLADQRGARIAAFGGKELSAQRGLPLCELSGDAAVSPDLRP